MIMESKQIIILLPTQPELLKCRMAQSVARHC